LPITIGEVREFILEYINEEITKIAENFSKTSEDLVFDISLMRRDLAPELDNHNQLSTKKLSFNNIEETHLTREIIGLDEIQQEEILETASTPNLDKAQLLA
jgi:hypothetical protein